MIGEFNLRKLIKNMQPKLNEGKYVFTTVKNVKDIERSDVICEFKENEGTTLIIAKEKADKLELNYNFISSWITLTIHSSLDAIGLTSVISAELTKHNISCNVVAGYYHDHLFVNIKDTERAMTILNNLTENY